MLPAAKVTAPFVGPRPFEASESEMFRGRSKEAADLYSLVIANRCVLLYSPSGAGKTSLINAGLFPKLKAVDELHVVNVRLSLNPSAVHANDFDSLLGVAAHKHFLCICDQFEELFFLKRSPSERQVFFEKLGDFLTVHKEVKLLISMREEWLAQIEVYAAEFPDDASARLRLDRLEAECAEEIIGTCFESSNVRLEARALSELVAELSDSSEQIEPVQLQVVCLDLWAAIPSLPFTITEDFRRVNGIVASALARFYEKCLLDTHISSRVSLSKLRHWFDNVLITNSGTRGLSRMGEKETDGVPNEAVTLLEDKHLVRAEVRPPDRWYELSHERLIKPVQAANSEWRTKQRIIRYGSLVALLTISLLILGYFLSRYIAIARVAQLATNQALATRDVAVAKKLILQIQRMQEVNTDDELGLLLIKTAAILEPREDLSADALFRILKHPYLVTVVESGVESANSAQWSPDGKRIAIAGLGNKITIWSDRPFHKLDETLPCLASNCSAIAWSPDGKKIAVGKADGDLVVSELGSPSTQLVHAHRGLITSIQWCLIGNRLITAANDGRVLAWDPQHFNQSPTVLLELKNRIIERVRIADTACSSEGKVAAGTYDGGLWVSDSPLTPLHLLKKFKTPVLNVAWSPSGQLASGGWDGGVRIWDSSVGIPKKEWILSSVDNSVDRTPNVYSVAWSHDGKFLYSGSTDQLIRVWDPNHPETDPISLRVSGGTPTVIAPSRDQYEFATIGGEARTGKIHFWLKNNEVMPEALPTPHQAPITTISLGPGDNEIATGASNGRLFVRQKLPSQRTYELSSLINSVNSVVASGDLIFGGGAYFSADPRETLLHGTVAVWDLRKARTTGRIRRDGSLLFGPEITRIALGSQERSLFAGTSSGNILSIQGLGNAHRASKETVFDSHPILALARLSDSSLEVISGGRFGNVDPQSGHVTSIPAMPCSSVEIAAFSADLRWSALACDKMMQIVNWPLGASSPKIFEMPWALSALAWFQDGKSLIYGTDSGGVGIINLSSGKALFSSAFPAHNARVNTLAASINNTEFFSGGSDNSIVEWHSSSIFDVDPCTYVHRVLTKLEWDLYIGSEIEVRSVCGSAPR